MLEHKIPVLITESPEYDSPDLKLILAQRPEFLITGSAQTAKQAISLMHNFAPQLVFVQEELYDVSGIEFVKMMYRRNIYPEVVFVARDYNHAYDTLELAPIDYLKVPVDHKSIEEMMERLKFKLKRDELKRKMDIYARTQDIDSKRVFMQKRGVVILHLNEIVFCRADLTNSVLVLSDGEQLPLKTGINETIETINSQVFYKISRSYCINRNYLRKIDKKNAKCIMNYENLSWEIPASRGVINRLESLYTIPTY